MSPDTIADLIHLLKNGYNQKRFLTQYAQKALTGSPGPRGGGGLQRSPDISPEASGLDLRGPFAAGKATESREGTKWGEREREKGSSPYHQFLDPLLASRDSNLAT